VRGGFCSFGDTFVIPRSGRCHVAFPLLQTTPCVYFTLVIFLMAGHIDVDDYGEDDSLLDSLLANLENLLLPNDNNARPTSSSRSITSSISRPRHASITAPPTPLSPLELRQNNPQDCSNLIIASVNRATVEISRTIIALNATFSQQLQQASISASNGIKSAQGSASTTISIVVLSASSATSSAFSSLTIANLAVNTAVAALSSVQLSASTAISSANLSIVAASSSLTLAQLSVTSVLSASSIDVARLSSSLTLLQASISSVQVTKGSSARLYITDKGHSLRHLLQSRQPKRHLLQQRVQRHYRPRRS
jgi:hypothetical protein